MRTLVNACLAILTGVAPLAAQLVSPEEIIQREGQLVFTDGASFYAFHKDSTFESGPVRRDPDGGLRTGIGGQTIRGRWRHPDRAGANWVVEGEWGWSGGFSSPPDYRRMVMHFTSVQGTGEPMRMSPASAAPVLVYKTYFVMQELVKIAPPGGRGSSERLPILQDLAATVSGKLELAQWRIYRDGGCVVRLGFAPVPVGTSEPPRAETQVWLLRADGTVIPPTRPPDEMGTTFVDSKVVSRTRVRIYQYPPSARTEAISLVVRVGDDYFTERVRR